MLQEDEAGAQLTSNRFFSFRSRRALVSPAVPPTGAHVTRNRFVSSRSRRALARSGPPFRSAELLAVPPRGAHVTRHRFVGYRSCRALARRGPPFCSAGLRPSWEARDTILGPTHTWARHSSSPTPPPTLLTMLPHASPSMHPNDPPSSATRARRNARSN